MCEKCAKTFTSEANLNRHFLTAAHINRKKTSSRWKVMRHVKKLKQCTICQGVKEKVKSW